VIIFFFAIGARDRASSRLRVWDHLEWFEERGAQVIADSLTPPAAQATKAGIAARIARRLPRWIDAFFRSDAVVIQESLLLWPLLYLRNVGKRRRVVFDFSDPVDRHGTGPKGTLRRFAFARMVRHADVVMVENKSYLASLRGQARRLTHFYGPVNATRYAAAQGVPPTPEPRQPAEIRIGWTGSPGTYRFVAPLMPIIDEIARDHPIEVMLIGVAAIDYEFRHARLSLVPWHEESEFEIVPTFDLGLFRLEPTPDALWRGAGKLFIYMAAGVPFVASDIGIAHGVIAEAGLGYPVPNDEEWERVLQTAVSDQHGRSRMARESAAYAREHMSYEAYRKLLSSLVETNEAAAR
jgi:glycosyltransferase involved in cell wall biosynthesis